MNNKTIKIMIDCTICVILSVIIFVTSINNWYIIPVISIGIIVILFIVFRSKKNDIDTGSPFAEEPVKDTKTKKEASKLELKAKKLYLDTQKYFVSLNYDKLKDILSDNLYAQFEKEMKALENNNKRAVRDNIEVFDMAVLGDNIVSIGVLEDKYTKSTSSTIKRKNVRYESYYEMTIVDNKIDDLKLIYCRSKKD